MKELLYVLFIIASPIVTYKVIDYCLPVTLCEAAHRREMVAKTGKPDLPTVFTQLEPDPDKVTGRNEVTERFWQSEAAKERL